VRRTLDFENNRFTSPYVTQNMVLPGLHNDSVALSANMVEICSYRLDSDFTLKDVED
jgi:hypothetical protein